MKTEELATKIRDLELRFEGLQDNVSLFQENINNNIYWFYSVLGIIVASVSAVGIALYFLVKTSISKGIERGIDQAENSIDKKVLKLIKENYPLKWAKGTVSGQFLEEGKFIKVTGLNGSINWDDPTTKLSISATDGTEPFSYVLLEQGEHSFTAGLLNYSSTLHGNNIEWVIVWQNNIEVD